MTWGATDVTVRFGDRVALDKVTLAVEPASVTAVVGADGAGKTTLLRALVGTVRPDSGTVQRPPARKIGYFSAASGVYPDLTVTENLDFAATAYGAHDPDRRAELLRFAGLTGAVDRLGGQLSGGMRQKLGLVMAMLHQPDLLVLDEPSTGVDPVSRTELSTLIVRAAASGAAVVVSTAYLDEAERANSVLVLHGGQVLGSGPPADVIAGVAGHVLTAPQRPAAYSAWRRGGAWHCWVPPGDAVPAGFAPATVDLEDAVIVAALQRRSR
jgi:ABC-2 type transport system ATP-binding protein